MNPSQETKRKIEEWMKNMPTGVMLEEFEIEPYIEKMFSLSEKFPRFEHVGYTVSMKLYIKK